MAAGDSTYKTIATVGIVPIESITLADGSDTTEVINSNIDKTLGSSITRDTAGTFASIKYNGSYTVTFGGESLETIFSTGGSNFIVNFVFIKVITYNDLVKISFDGGTTDHCTLFSEGSFFASEMALVDEDISINGGTSSVVEIYAEFEQVV